MSTEEATLEALSQKYGLVALPAMVEKETAMLKQEFACRFRYESLTGKVPTADELEVYRDEIPAEAVRRVRAQLVVKKVIRDMGFTVTPEELETEVQAIASRQGTSPEQVKNFMGNDMSLLRNDLLERKAIAWICSAGINQL